VRLKNVIRSQSFRSLALLNLALGIEVLESLLDALRHRLLAFADPNARVVVPSKELVEGH
jgi:hypothetical protein